MESLYRKALVISPCFLTLSTTFLNDLRGKGVKSDAVNRKVKKLISGVMESLNDNGIILAFHEPGSDMFGKIGFRFGGAMHDATERIAKAAKELGHVVVSMPLESKLYFPKLSAAQIARLRS